MAGVCKFPEQWGRSVPSALGGGAVLGVRTGMVLALNHVYQGGGKNVDAGVWQASV